MILALLACPNLWFKTRIFLLRLTKYIGFLCLIVIIVCLSLATLICINFFYVAMFSTNKFRSCLICAIGRPFCISSMWIFLSGYVILLSCSYPSEIRLNLYSSTRTTLSSLIDAPLTRAICTFPIFSDQMIYSLAVVKSHILKYILSTKKLWLLVKWWDIYESKYQVNQVCDIVRDSVIIKALSGQKNFRLELLFSATLIVAFTCHSRSLDEMFSWSCLVLLLQLLLFFFVW